VLEQALIDRFGLTDAYVLLSGQDQRGDELLAGVGRLAAGYLERMFNLLPYRRVHCALPGGTGVHAAVNALAEDRTHPLDVVQIIGSVGAPNPTIDGPDLARLLAGKLGGRYYDLHAPVLVAQPALRDLLLNEPSMRFGLQRAARRDARHHRHWYGRARGRQLFACWPPDAGPILLC
jgi:deoxyribonucleoside regulator